MCIIGVKTDRTLTIAPNVPATKRTRRVRAEQRPPGSEVKRSYIPSRGLTHGGKGRKLGCWGETRLGDKEKASQLGSVVEEGGDERNTESR